MVKTMPGSSGAVRHIRPRPGDHAGLLVHVEPETVPGPVSERLAQAVRFEHAAGGGIDRGRQSTPGRTAAIAACWASSDRRVHPARLLPTPAPTDTVRVKSQQYPSKTPPKSSTTRSPAASRRSPARWCGRRRIGPRCDDGVEGQPLVAGLAQRRFDHRRDLPFGACPAGPRRAPPRPPPSAAQPTPAAARHLEGVLRPCRSARPAARSSGSASCGRRGAALSDQPVVAAPRSGAPPRSRRCDTPSSARHPTSASS